MRYLVAAFSVLLLFSITAQAVAAVSGPSGHGCASPTPPGIAGSPAPAPAVSGIILINEVLLVPHSTWNCSETPGTYFDTTDAWIELYNTQNQPYDLYAAHALIDSGPNTNFYTFPLGAAIAAHGFLVIFPRTAPDFTATETPTLRLVISNVVIDQVSVPTLGPDQSYARTSDGASSWEITSTPTIDASNTSLQVTPTPTVSSGRSSSRSSRSSRSGDGSSSGSTDSGSRDTTRGSYNRALINGVQPRWNTLQLPATTPTPVVDTAPAALSSTPAPAPVSSGLDLPRRIALTVSVIVLALALFWCWRLFKKE